MGGIMDQLKQLLQRFAVWFFGLFSQLAEAATAGELPQVAGHRVVTIHTRHHWDEVFQEAKAEGKEAVLAYFTKWSSPPCKFIRPWFAELSKQYTNVKFVTVYVEDLEELAVAAGVQFIPEFQLFQGGAVEKVQGSKRPQVESLLRTKVTKPEARIHASTQAVQVSDKKLD